jgi:hypothetical protein
MRLLNKPGNEDCYWAFRLSGSERVMDWIGGGEALSVRMIASTRIPH